MYIRNTNGIIGLFNGEKNNQKEIDVWVSKNKIKRINTNDIVMTSDIICGVIAIGDFVQGHRVVQVHDDCIWIEGEYGSVQILNNKIINVVTAEKYYDMMVSV